MKKTLKILGKSIIFLCYCVLFIFTLGMVWLSLYSADFPRSRNVQDSKDAVSAAFKDSGPFENPFFVVTGFLQGVTCYYRFQASKESVETFVTREKLIEIYPNISRYVEFSAGTFYWWKPQKQASTHFYGNGPDSQWIFSWDEDTHICYLILNGG